MLLRLFIAITLFAGAAGAETRMALVIGNAAYEVGPLANPANDARLAADSFAASGFEVETLIDGDRNAMKRAIAGFAARLKQAGPDAVAAFFYAGHGIQANGRNYLIPVNAPLRSEADLDYETVEAQWVLDLLGAAGARMSIIILDACRNNPFPAVSRGVSRGLARMDAPRGSILAYSTAPGDVAADGDGANSPFTRALAKAIRTPGLKIEDTFKQVRREVLAATDNAQLPWESTSLTGDFYFMPGGGARPGPAPAQPAAVRPTVTPPAPAAPAPKPEPAPQPAAQARDSGRFVPKERSMADHYESDWLRCYDPNTGDVTSYAPGPANQCRGNYYRITEGDFFEVLKND